MIVKRYQGKVVKRMRLVPGGILLTFLSHKPGEPGEQLVVSQSQWNEHATETFEPGMTLARLREQQRKLS